MNTVSPHGFGIKFKWLTKSPKIYNLKAYISAFPINEMTDEIDQSSSLTSEDENNIDDSYELYSYHSSHSNDSVVLCDYDSDISYSESDLII